MTRIRAKKKRIVKLGPALSRGVEWNRSQKEYNTYRS